MYTFYICRSRIACLPTMKQTCCNYSLTPSLRYRYRYSGTQVLRYTGTQVLRYLRYSGTQVLRYLRYSGTRVLRYLRYSGTQVPQVLRYLRYSGTSGTQVLRYSGTSGTQVLRYLRYSGTQVHRYSGTQVQVPATATRLVPVPSVIQSRTPPTHAPFMSSVSHPPHDFGARLRHP